MCNMEIFLFLYKCGQLWQVAKLQEQPTSQVFLYKVLFS
jgi:hypothetical protein